MVDQNAPGIEYLVHYKEKGSSYDPQHVYAPESKNKVKLIMIDSDAFYKPYEIQVQAQNDVGYGPLSPTIIAYTGERCKSLFCIIKIFYLIKISPRPQRNIFSFEYSGFSFVITSDSDYQRFPANIYWFKINNRETLEKGVK